MEKTLTIDGRQVLFKSTGAFLLRYKAQFGRDALRDLLRLEQAYDEKSGRIKDLEALDMDLFYNLVWTLAKTARPDLPPPMEWLDGFEEFPLMDILPELMDLLRSSIGRTVQSKKK